ncbi:MAG: helix-turn-helix transcriptional regulator [Rhizobacter sp.]|nr:helix-turn-helix transcriptional regulator [Rhizobacter sp.]
MPAGTFELVVNLHENRIRVFGADGQARHYAGMLVSGAFSQSFVVDTREHACMVGVHFKPGGARAFLGARADELADQHMDLAAIWSPVAADRLHDALASAPCAAKRFAILERTLRQHLVASLARRPFTIALLSNPGAPIAALAQACGRSHRSFIDSFSAEVGMTPKLFQRVQRFQRAFALAAGPQAPGWAQLSLDCGYADQSHLIRDFVAFAGMTPGDYARARGAAVKSDHIALA